MKKRLVIISEALAGGVRRHIVDLLENVDINEFDIYFLYNLDRADSVIRDKLAYLEQRGIKLIEIPKFNREIGINDLYAFINIYKLLKRIKPNIVHCHSTKAGVLGRIAAKILNVDKIIYTPHAYIFQDPNLSKFKKKFYVSIEYLLHRFMTDNTINVSEEEKNIALRNFNCKSDKFQVVFNGISSTHIVSPNSVTKMKETLKIEETDIVIGNIARVDYQKDPFTFIQIAESICSLNSNVKFLFVGEGGLYEECVAYLKEKNLQDKILFTGFVVETDVMLDIFDIFFTTSLYEGLPYSSIEALRAQLPIVGTDIAGNNELIFSDKNGYMFEIGNLEEGKEQLEKIINSQILRKNMGINSYNIFEMNFKLSNMLNKLVDIYRS